LRLENAPATPAAASRAPTAAQTRHGDPQRQAPAEHAVGPPADQQRDRRHERQVIAEALLLRCRDHDEHRHRGHDQQEERVALRTATPQEPDRLDEHDREEEHPREENPEGVLDGLRHHSGAQVLRQIPEDLVLNDGLAQAFGVAEEPEDWPGRDDRDEQRHAERQLEARHDAALRPNTAQAAAMTSGRKPPGPLAQNARPTNR
jgi:hypothetical protein